MKNGSIPVVDLFAGPGGLGEGFASYSDSRGGSLFKVVVSLEKDKFAHQTLELRALFRELKARGSDLKNYYQYIRGEGNISREQLFQNHRVEGQIARSEAQLFELCKENRTSAIKIIRNRLGSSGQKGIWGVLGGPPCQAYSVAGRSRMRSKLRSKFENDHRHTLYEEYLAILDELKPAFFVMENVRGILSSEYQSRNIFTKILEDLNDLSEAYVLLPFNRKKSDDQSSNELCPKDFIVKAEYYGIPQCRHRVILLGVRNDLISLLNELTAKEPVKPEDFTSVRDVLAGLPRLRSGLTKTQDSPDSWLRYIRGIDLSGPISASSIRGKRRLRLQLRTNERRITKPRADRGSRYIQSSRLRVGQFQDWYVDPELEGICNHESRGHMASDLQRYYFASNFAQVWKRSPRLSEFPEELLPDHQNVPSALGGGTFDDRFRVQVWDRPATTITSHISKDGHYYIHPDPTQCRSFTVREAARIQTFPDNYFFEGPRTEQYRQVGNAVPPLLAKQLAGSIAEMFAKEGVS